MLPKVEIQIFIGFELNLIFPQDDQTNRALIVFDSKVNAKETTPAPCAFLKIFKYLK